MKASTSRWFVAAALLAVVAPFGCSSTSSTRPVDDVRTCTDLCTHADSVSASQVNCVATFLELRGFPVSTQCAGIATEGECNACARQVEVDDAACVGAFDECIGGGTSGTGGTSSGTGGSATGGTSGGGGSGAAGAQGGTGGGTTGGPRCTGDENCDLSCPSSGCALSCDGNSDCTGQCPLGGCSMTCTGNANCVFDCLGGGCTMTCNENSSCQMGCTGGGCIYSCTDNADDCITTCLGAGCTGP